MEREQIVEEMARDIHNAKRASDYHCYEDEYTDCQKCKLLKYAENKMCQDAYEACCLIEDGYRKIHDDEVVLTKKEYERLKSDRKIKVVQHLDDEFTVEIPQCEYDDMLDQIRKEAMGEVLKKVDHESNGQTIMITNYLRKKFGVEVEE